MFSRFIKSFILPVAAIFNGRISVTTDYKLFFPEQGSVETKFDDAWKDQNIPKAQRAIVNTELKHMYQKEVIPIYRILAEAVRMTGCENGKIIEVGCASGYYSEVLAFLLQHAIEYVGIDYSRALIDLALLYYPNNTFLVGDASELPFASKTADIVISGCVLLHMANYRHGIAESVRVSRNWVIFHRTPVVIGPTIHFTKLAYGVRCLEIAFGQDDLLNLFRENGLTLVKTYEIGENRVPCTTYRGYGVTYLCKVN